jgi:predicted MFS family arabinose efflux permease
VTFVLGPPLALGVGAIWSTEAAPAFAGIVMLVATVAFAAQPESRAWRPDPGAPRPRGGSLRSPAIITLALIELGTGAVFGATDVGVTAAAKALGSSAAAGPLLGLWGAGSLLGGLAATRLGGGARRSGGLVVLLAALALAHGAVVFATGSVPAIGAVILLAGATIAPTAASIYAMVDRFAPEGTRTEAFSWAVTAASTGEAIGAAVAGPLVQSAGAAAAFAFAGAAGAVAVGVALQGSRRLDDPSCGPVDPATAPAHAA